MIVIKLGGHAMKDGASSFANALENAMKLGSSFVIVHGGGPAIDKALKARGIESIFVGGYRVTTPEIFHVVEEVLSNEVGPAIVSSLKEAGINAVAISGRSSGTLIAEPLEILIDGRSADLGLVGKVISVDLTHIQKALADGCTPVLSPVATGSDVDKGFNVNADSAAAAVAASLQADTLIIMTDVLGIYRNWPDSSSLISEISSSELEEIKGTFSEGMAPKAQACLDAISLGAKSVRIIDGSNEESFESALAGFGGTLVIA